MREQVGTGMKASQELIDFSTATPEMLRHFFARSDAQRDRDKRAPTDVDRLCDQDYALDGTSDHCLDVYWPSTARQPIPTIVNIHGGGWIYGSKGQYQYYCMALAQKGFAVVNCNYRLSPEHRFPAPLEDLCMVLRWLEENQERCFADTDRLFLVGDSAGAQIASQLLAMLSNPKYAACFPFELPKVTIRAAALNCGMYDLLGGMFDTAGHPVPPGTNYMPDDYALRREQLDVFAAINNRYPPIFLMGSVNDPISQAGFEPFRRLLEQKGCSVAPAWYGQDDPSLGHVFHIDISLSAAQSCNEDELAFFRKYL